MGLDIVLESEQKCRQGMSPKTVLPSHRRSLTVETVSTEEKPACINNILILDKDFLEINFNRYSSFSCGGTPSAYSELEGVEVLKQGSMYQNSNALRETKKLGTIEDRRKIEMSNNWDASFPFRIINALCSSDEECAHVEHKRSRARSMSSCIDMESISKPSSGTVPTTSVTSDEFLEIVLNFDNRKKNSACSLEEDSSENRKFRCHQVAGPLNDGNDLPERDAVTTLHKSLYAKVGMSLSPSQLKSYQSKVSSRVRFGHLKKMFDPFAKLKSHWTPLGSVMESDEIITTGLTSIRRNKALRKSLLDDFSNATPNAESDCRFVRNDRHHLDVPSSPTHLQGHLKVEYKHGVPLFEFTLKCPEDVLVAKTWKADNAFNWVYTFHSVRRRKKSNVSGRGLKYSNKESSVVGQMQVSCYVCSEIKDGGDLDNSLVAEFVLYDITHARKSVSTLETSKCSPKIASPSTASKESLVRRNVGLDDLPVWEKIKGQQNRGLEHGDINSTPYPWTPAELHPNLEVAAIVIVAPVEKRESMECKRGDKNNNQEHLSPADLSMVELGKKDHPSSLSLTKVKVVTPTGNHGLPTTESRGPLSLLDRWRKGGGCDCGGWDMACPLNVFTSPSAVDCPLVEHWQPLQLFVQGAKEDIPALTMEVIEEGQYAINFHARLSMLQAFSICVAVLHDTEASTAVAQERNKGYLQSNSLKMLIEDEVKLLLENITEEEKKKVTKVMPAVPPSFVVNPPFSPIARV